MPRFHPHESLRGGLCQGVVDRVSFYSVVQDINKEATDAAETNPRGGTYNDGSVHGRDRGPKDADPAAVPPDPGQLEPRRR